MTMNFRLIKYSIVNNVLGPAEAGRFRTVGYQQQQKGADEYVDDSRSVQVYYSTGDFDKRGSSLTGPVQHGMTFRIELTVAKAAEGDISTAANSTDSATIAAALANFQNAAEIVDEAFDELADIVFQILMDARNIDLGLSVGVLANRFITGMEKDQPLPRGEYVLLTGVMTLTLSAEEVVVGDTGQPLEFINTVIDVEDDDVEQTVVEVDTT